MENASKALLIAGAILVCILLIGVGMMVYNSAQGTVSEAISQMSSHEKDMFNQQFEQYAGSRVNGSNVRALLQKIRNSNNQNSDVPEKQVKVTGIVTTSKNNSVEKLPDNATTQVVTASTYTVTVSDSDSDGLVDTVNIVKSSGNTSTGGTN